MKKERIELVAVRARIGPFHAPKVVEGHARDRVQFGLDGRLALDGGALRGRAAPSGRRSRNAVVLGLRSRAAASVGSVFIS